VLIVFTGFYTRNGKNPRNIPYYRCASVPGKPAETDSIELPPEAQSIHKFRNRESSVLLQGFAHDSILCLSFA
jgi:hypothetical protein